MISTQWWTCRFTSSVKTLGGERGQRGFRTLLISLENVLYRLSRGNRRTRCLCVCVFVCVWPSKIRQLYAVYSRGYNTHTCLTGLCFSELNSSFSVKYSAAADRCWSWKLLLFLFSFFFFLTTDVNRRVNNLGVSALTLTLTQQDWWSKCSFFPPHWSKY